MNEPGSEPVLPTAAAPIPVSPSPSGGPSVLGIVRSVHSLLTPLQFTPTEPSHRDEPYRPERIGRGIPPLADVYLPPGDGPHRSVVLVHGGGWVLGHRRMKPMRYLASQLLEQGYAVYIPEYRMVFRGGRLDEAVDDTTCAIKWWLESADRFGLDRAGVSLAGLSAGATLMMLAADNLKEVGFRRLLAVFGVYDFTEMHGGIGKLIRPLFLREHVPRSVSPLHREPHPSPVTLFHGTADTLVPHSQAVALKERWNAQGGRVDLVSYEGLPHAFFNDARSEACRAATKDLLVALGS